MMATSDDSSDNTCADLIPYIDLHSHDLGFSEEVLKLNSLSLWNLPKIDLQDLKNPFTIGIHPWEILDSENAKGLFSENKNTLQEILALDLCVGVGEIGLDRAKEETTYDLQMQIFKEQVLWAIESQVKTLVVHCVRAQNDILKVIKDLNYKGQIIFHDYNGSAQEAQQVLDLGHIISLGRKILNPDTKAHKWLSAELKNPNSASWGQFFLETDDADKTNIEALYKQASLMGQMDALELQKKFHSHLPAFLSAK